MPSLPVPNFLAYEHGRRSLIARVVALVAGPIAALFGVINFIDGHFLEASGNVFLSLVAVALCLAARPSRNLRRSYIAIQTLLIIFIIGLACLEFFSVFAEHRYSRLLWLIPFPLLIFFTMGKKIGLVLVVCLTAALGVLMHLNFAQASGVRFVTADVWRFLGAFIAMCLAGFCIERALRDDRESLLQKQRDLERSEDLYREACLNLVEEVNRRSEVELSQQGLMEQLRQGQKMEALGQLAGGVVHDFNNLLGSMMGFTHMAQKTLPEGHAQKENLSLALKAGDKAQLLLRRLLDFSRHDEPKREPLYLGRLVSGALELTPPLLVPGVTMKSWLPQSGQEDLVVKANAIQLEQVLFNLCKNASQAMAQDGGLLSVKLEKIELSDKQAKDLELRPGSYALLSVCDTGPGLHVGQFDKIFDPFYTTKDRGKGTGMGLFVTRSIVESHGGRIKVRNRHRQGARFSVYLPLSRERPAEPAETESAEMPRGQGQCVLYVDDDPSLAKNTRMVLEELGYQIELCGSAEEALGKLHSNDLDIDLLISDQNMSGISGDELARQCRLLHPSLPVIITTGSAGLFEGKSLSDLGVQDILAKPVSARRIAQAIDKALKQAAVPA
jgi:signal transduction histidine kinase/CheY-like chemotaxis protein